MSFLQSWFPPQIDPETLVELWSVILIECDGKCYANRTLHQQSTWKNEGNHVLEALDVPSKTFSITQPAIVVVLTLNARRNTFLYTRSEFERLYKVIPLRNREEEIKWNETILAMLSVSALDSEIKVLQGQLKITKLEIEMMETLIQIAEKTKKK